MSENRNRAFMYGESVFTTMRMKDGRLQDWNHHFERLSRSVEFVYGPFTDEERWISILKGRLIEKCAHESGNKVIRLSLYRDYLRRGMQPSLISVLDLKIDIQSSAFDPSTQREKNLKLRTCPAFLKPSWWPGYLKAGNYLETIMAQKYYLKGDDDDLAFLDSDGALLESSVANLFVVKNNKLYTAPVGPNVLDGIMRKKVLHAYHDLFDECIEDSSTLEQTYRADAIFGSNSVRGLFLIDRIDETDIICGQEFIKKFQELKSRVM